ncbi:MAG TPA: saccharopine dehydrogenase [Methylomirabilota bacterium]|nr:saccharopine dehydrogenase [Methylomirabilota bacterium]
MASTLGLHARVFDLDDPAPLDRGLAGMRAVLHCAGPFAHTSRPMVDACLDNRIAYLDITGEVPVFEACAARDAEARAASVMLMPGGGFDVVPSDCLAAHLRRRLPTATELWLAISGLTQASHGTAATMIEGLHRGGLVRRGGVLSPVALGHRARLIDFGRGPETAIAILWGDLSTASHSTGIPNITIYMAMPAAMRAGIAVGVFAPVLRSAVVQRVLKVGVRAGPAGPTDTERARGASYVWGRSPTPGGRRAVSRLRTPEGYTLTALAALEITARVIGGAAPIGYQTPASAYGPDLILAIPGCERSDDPIV